MNIVGEGFPKKIISQVYNRQKVYGSGYSSAISRTPEEIIYLNANSSWCKLVSSTDIDDIDKINNPTIKNLKLQGTKLAEQFILFNGTAANDGSSSRAGIDLTGNLSGNNKAYGIGGTEFGLRPMMGIQSVSVTHENRGSLRQATVKMKAWNKTQFEIIDVLYLRLGFSVLLEWGNSMYFNNNYELQTNPNNSLAYDFLNGKMSYNTFLKKIQQNRITSLGNYDAMFAKVKNFSWSFQKDGSYDITLDLISSGDVIESLKINALIEDAGGTNTKVTSGESDDDKPTENDNEIITYYATKHSIGQFFWFLRYQMDFADLGVEHPTQPLYKMFSFSDYNTTPEEQNLSIITENIIKEIQETINPVETAVNETVAGWFDSDFVTQKPTLPAELDKKMFEVYDTEGNLLKVWDMVQIAWDDKEGNDETYYVRLGTFLAYLQNYLMPKQLHNGADPKTEAEPILNFDYDQNTNLMFAHKWQVGVDPRICTVGRTITIDYGIFYNSSTPVPFSSCCSPFIHEKYNGITKDTEYGNIMNIYVNMIFILNKIDELKDDKGKLSLFDLLKAICDGINEGLGGLNSLEPIIDEVENTVKIIDANPLPNRDQVLNVINSFSDAKYKNLEISTELVEFDLYGYKTDSNKESALVYNKLGHASFIKDFSFATEITPGLATMVTVGAAANGSVVGENQTALSKLNVGLSDRYKKEVLDIYELKKRQKEEQEEKISKIEEIDKTLESLKERYIKTLNSYFDWLEEISDFPPEILATQEPTLNVDEVEAYKGVLLNIVQYEEQYITNLRNKRVLEGGDPDESRMATGTGFIPFNLSVTMDGLSGMKIYSKFIVDTSYLPSNYPNNVEFLIKGITHEIADNKWTTKLESFCVSKGNFEGTLSKAASGLTTATEATTPTTPAPTSPNPIPSPDWSKYNVGQTSLLKNAVRDQSTYVYSKGIYSPQKGLETPKGYGEVPGYCAGYTYNIAYKLKDYISSKSNRAMSFTYRRAADANTDLHRQNILNLGIYDIYYLGDYKASELKNGFVSKFKWNYGDILNYYAPGYAPPHNMHSQMYTGDIWTKGINGKGEADAANSQGWSTSGATNYGTQFVYKSSDLVFKVYAFKVKTEYLK